MFIIPKWMVYYCYTHMIKIMYMIIDWRKSKSLCDWWCLFDWWFGTCFLFPAGVRNSSSLIFSEGVCIPPTGNQWLILLEFLTTYFQEVKKNPAIRKATEFHGWMWIKNSHGHRIKIAIDRRGPIFRIYIPRSPKKRQIDGQMHGVNTLHFLVPGHSKPECEVGPRW